MVSIVRLVPILAAMALAVGCQQRAVAPVTPITADAGPRTLTLKAQGDAAMAQQHYEEAALKYQAALNQAPDDVSIRYALATALSYLDDRRDDTIANFRVVLLRGAPGSFEVGGAREWLANAGALGEGEGFHASPDMSSLTSDRPEQGRVFGKIEWQGIEPHSRLVRLNITLTGDEAENSAVSLRREFKIGRVYEFRDVPSGTYRLVADVAGTPMWDTKVVVPPGKDTSLDLTETNAAAPKDFTPPD